MKLWRILPLMMAFAFITLVGAETGAGQQSGDTKEQSSLNPIKDIDVDALLKYRTDRLAMLKRQENNRPSIPMPQHIRSVAPRPTGLHFLRADTPMALENNFSLAKGMATGPLSILINGVESATSPQGSPFVVTVDFSDNSQDANITMWIDVDGDGILDDAIDFLAEDDIHIFDNDMEDEEKTLDGVYQTTLRGDDGPGNVAGLRILIRAEDAGGADTAAAYIAPVVTDFYVTGSVTPAKENVLIGAFPSETTATGSPTGGGPEPLMTVTDNLGAYTLYLEKAGQYEIFAFDFMGIMAGLIPDTSYHNENLVTTLTGIDFEFVEANSHIAGYVRDDFDNPVVGIEVMADNDHGGSAWDTTDVSGYFILDVTPGNWWVGAEVWNMPEFMDTDWQEVFVMEGTTAPVAINLFRTDAIITGTVYLGTAPLPGISIGAWGDPVGYTHAVTDASGVFELHVSSKVDPVGYSLWPENHPENTSFSDHLWNIPPGATGVDIHFVATSGGITGFVTVVGTSAPVDTLKDAWIWAWDEANQLEFGVSTDWMTGEYTLHLPAGEYWVGASAEGFFDQEEEITVATVLIDKDFALETIAFSGSISGNITDCAGGFGLSGVGIEVWDENHQYGDFQETDAEGNYHFDLPAGTYDMWVFAPGYHDTGDLAVVSTGDVLKNFCLDPFMSEPPMIVDIQDIDPDQGGWVTLTFNGGATDGGPYVGWSIWNVPTPESLPEEWLFVNFVPFHGHEMTTTLIPTLVDSNATTGLTDAFWSTFVVTGHTFDMGNWSDSDPASGYSVDNIVPQAPQASSISAAGNGALLAWAISSDDDFSYFAVYRSTTQGTYGADPEFTLVENSWLDGTVTGGTVYYYQITTFDANGNESDPTAELSVTALDIAKGAEIPVSFALGSNYPNPFNPSTTLTYQLPEASSVSIVIYDLTGSEVATLVDGHKAAGYYSTRWNGTNNKGALVPTGIYFYRIQTDAGFTATRKMVFIK